MCRIHGHPAPEPIAFTVAVPKAEPVPFSITISFAVPLTFALSIAFADLNRGRGGEPAAAAIHPR